jgi:hypothetical protein
MKIRPISTICIVQCAVITTLLWQSQEPKLVQGSVMPGTRGHAGKESPLQWRGRIWLPRELQGHDSSGITYPFDTALIGPVGALRAKLVAEQDGPPAGGPALIRFEIYDAWGAFHREEYMGPPTKTSDNSPFRLRALLYWAYGRPGDETPIGSVRLRYLPAAKATLMHGAQLGKVVVEKREYIVRPASSHRLGTSIVQDDWKVEDDGALIEKETRIVGDFNDAAAIFDISQRAFEKAP